jgi:hypothetical protein
MGTMADGLSDAEIDEIEQRVTKALEVAPQPWVEYLESRYSTGGSSYVQIGGNDVEQEIYVNVYVDDDHWQSPDPRLDAIIDLLGHAPADLQLLLQELRRLRPRNT